MLFTKTKNESRKALIKHQKKIPFRQKVEFFFFKQSVSSTESQEDKKKGQKQWVFSTGSR